MLIVNDKKITTGHIPSETSMSISGLLAKCLGREKCESTKWDYVQV